MSTITKMIEMRKRGDSYNYIGETLGISNSTVRDRLIKWGIEPEGEMIPRPRRDRGRGMLDLDVPEIIRLYIDEKWSIIKISRHFGVNANTIHHRLFHSGVKLRTLSEACLLARPDKYAVHFPKGSPEARARAFKGHATRRKKARDNAARRVRRTAKKPGEQEGVLNAE